MAEQRVYLWSCGCTAPRGEDGQPVEHGDDCLHNWQPEIKPSEDEHGIIEAERRRAYNNPPDYRYMGLPDPEKD